MSVKMSVLVFCTVMPRGFTSRYHCFRKAYCLSVYLQSWSEVIQVWVTLALMISQSVSLSCWAPIGTHDTFQVAGPTTAVFVITLHPLWWEGGSVLCHMSWSLSSLYIFILLLTTYQQMLYLHFFLHSVYMASGSPGFVQQIMPYLT
jgi:hypothetical protein